MKLATTKLFVTLGALLMLALAAQAHVLKLKDGRTLQGTFISGSQDEIQFQVEGKIEVFKLSDVASVDFTESTGESAMAEPSAETRAARGVAVTVPEGTRLLVRMIDGIDSKVNHVGDLFHASLEDNLVVGETVVAKKGADVYGKLAQAKSAGHIAGKSELSLELTGLRTVGGNIQPVTSADYKVAGKSRGKQSAERIGGGAALGAIIGGIAGGGRGAAIGAGAGAGAGTAVQVITHGEQVKVPSETLLEFRLDQPFTVNVEK